tara:strand:- start:55 stop:498 length:444 start_codon:yes stop_codon:yes gene_type:complete
MNNELGKYLINNINEFKNDSEETKNKIIKVANIGYLAELYYAEKRNAELMPINFPGYDLDDKTEIKSATTSFTKTGSQISINGLGTKAPADLIIIIYNDLVNKVIAEVTVTPDDIKKVDGTMPTQLNIDKKNFRREFADKTKILASY